MGLRVYKSHPFIIYHPALLVLLAWGLVRMKPWLAKLSTAVLIAAQLYVLVTLVSGGDYVKPRSADTADWIETSGGIEARVAVIPAFIPNPMPIVGDWLLLDQDTQIRFANQVPNQVLAAYWYFSFSVYSNIKQRTGATGRKVRFCGPSHRRGAPGPEPVRRLRSRS